MSPPTAAPKTPAKIILPPVFELFFIIRDLIDSSIPPIVLSSAVHKMATTLNIKTPHRSDLSLTVPSNWTVRQLKEHLLMHHSESPEPQSQKLILEARELANDTCLRELGSELTVHLLFDKVQVLTNELFNSDDFKEREENELARHARAIKNLSKEADLLRSLPICHPVFKKRVKIQTADSRRVKLSHTKLRDYLNWNLLARTLPFLLLCALLGGSITINLMLVVLFYLIHIRVRIDQHLEMQLGQLPRTYLALILPDDFGALKEHASFPLWRSGYETCKGFAHSLFPWFRPDEYAEYRQRVL
mmetsp:Transcript_6525/g.11421  ORF Transcript_6525/g.11421 Transcript_6525/m.11421 type:complete len:303 (-) Transcript_6525:5032-5940(-)